MLGMKYPGGKHIENKALRGNKNEFDLPKPLINRKDFNFSFSGLKTAVKLEVNKFNKLNNNQVENLCASFQQTIVDILVSKTEMAINYAKNKIPNINNVVVAGGVAANKSIKDSLQILCQKNNLKLFFPPLSLCGDNAAMIAWACLQRYKLGYQGNINFKPIPRWSLNDLA